MTKKERRIVRTLDAKLGMPKGTHEYWVKAHPHIKCAIISTARKENRKND